MSVAQTIPAVALPPARRSSDGLVLLAGLISLVTLLLASPVGDWGPFRHLWDEHRTLVHVFKWTGFAAAAGVLVLARRRAPIRVALIVLMAALCQIPGLMSPPQSSSDAYRYVWDGRVQLAGVSPYRYVPLDDHLARLRDPVLFPGLTPQEHSGVTTPRRVPTDPAQVAALAQNDPRTELNRPRVPTIYPPVAQAYFTAIAAVTPWSWGTAGLQWAAALLAIGMTAALGVVLRRRFGDPLLAAIWGWSPLVVLETGNNAHVDILAAALILGAMLVLCGVSRPGRAGRNARLGGGILIGLAVATKILPLVLLPAVTLIRQYWPRPRWLQVPVAAVGTAALSYVPHVLAAGTLVLGYLPGYLSEEGFSSGSQRYALLALVVPEHLRQPVALLALVALALVALWRARECRPEVVAVWLFGGSLLISTPAYPWYCLPLLALAMLARRPEWLAVGLATQWSYMHIHSPGPVSWGYALALAVVVVTGVVRHRRRPEGRPDTEPATVQGQEVPTSPIRGAVA